MTERLGSLDVASLTCTHLAQPASQNSRRQDFLTSIFRAANIFTRQDSNFRKNRRDSPDKTPHARKPEQQKLRSEKNSEKSASSEVDKKLETKNIELSQLFR